MGVAVPNYPRNPPHPPQAVRTAAPHVRNPQEKPRDHPAA